MNFFKNNSCGALANCARTCLARTCHAQGTASPRVLQTSRIAQSKNGFTLIETLVYIAILAMVITSIASYSLSLSGARNKNYSVQNVQANSRVLLSSISEKIRASAGVLTPSAGAGSNLLILDMHDNAPNIIFSIINGQLIMTEDAGADKAITDDRVLVGDLIFTNSALVGERDIISFEMDISSNVALGDVENSFTQHLSTSVITRN